MIIPEWVLFLAQIGSVAGLAWILFNMPTPGIDRLLDEIYSPKIYITDKYMPTLTREDLEKYHPELMAALDNIPQMEREIQRLTNKEDEN